MTERILAHLTAAVLAFCASLCLIAGLADLCDPDWRVDGVFSLVSAAALGLFAFFIYRALHPPIRGSKLLRRIPKP
jgi:hypothetical protein